MNIIEAREAALAGKTVIDPRGNLFVANNFEIEDPWLHEDVFCEWSIKQEPVVFEASVWRQSSSVTGGSIGSVLLHEFIGKRVKVTVEVIE